MAPSLQTLAEQAAKGIEDAAELFKQPAPSSTAESAQPDVARGLAERVKGDAAKIGVMASGALSASEADGLLKSLRQLVDALCICLFSLTSGAGPSLKEAIKSGASAVATESAALARLVGQESERSEQTLKRAVGKVWDACDAVKKQPLDNKAALFRQLAAVVRVAKDTLREMDDLARSNDPQQSGSAQQGNGHSQNGHRPNGALHTHREEVEEGEDSQQSEADQESEAGSDGADGGEESGLADLDDADFTNEPLSSDERQVLSAGRQLMQLTVQGVQTLAKPLLQPSALPSDQVEAWESCAWHTKALKRGIEDLGAALYAPQDPEEVSGAAEAIAISLECMLTEVPEGCDAELYQQLERVSGEVDTVKERLDELLQQTGGEREQ